MNKIDWKIWPPGWTFLDKLLFGICVLVSLAVGIIVLPAVLPFAAVTMAVMGALLQLEKICLLLAVIDPARLRIAFRILAVILIIIAEIVIEVAVLGVTGAAISAAPQPSPNPFPLLPFPAVEWTVIGKALLVDPFALCLIARIASVRRGA